MYEKNFIESIHIRWSLTNKFTNVIIPVLIFSIDHTMESVGPVCIQIHTHAIYTVWWAAKIRFSHTVLRIEPKFFLVRHWNCVSFFFHRMFPRRIESLFVNVKWTCQIAIPNARSSPHTITRNHESHNIYEFRQNCFESFFFSLYGAIFPPLYTNMFERRVVHRHQYDHIISFPKYLNTNKELRSMELSSLRWAIQRSHRTSHPYRGHTATVFSFPPKKKKITIQRLHSKVGARDSNVHFSVSISICFLSSCCLFSIWVWETWYLKCGKFSPYFHLVCHLNEISNNSVHQYVL